MKEIENPKQDENASGYEKFEYLTRGILKISKAKLDEKLQSNKDTQSEPLSEGFDEIANALEEMYEDSIDEWVSEQADAGSFDELAKRALKEHHNNETTDL